MDQIKERCIYCGSDVYYTGTEGLLKCGMCGHTLVVAKFENELARMNQAIEEGEQAKKDLVEAEKARQEAEVRLQNTLENLDEIKGGQDVLSLLVQSVIAEQDTAEGKLAQVKDITERILKGQGDIIEGMTIFGEIKDKLQEIGLNEQARKDFADRFVDWFRNIHTDDVERMEQLQDRTSSILAEQKEISDKIDSLHQVSEETKAKIDAFENRYAQDKLGEIRQLYHQAQNYQFDRAYDKAYDKYEKIVIKGGGDAAVLWHMILCHYCVSYQENDEGEMIPIIMNPDLTDPDEMSLRLDFENILNDRSMVTEEQEVIYRHELGKIDHILNEYRNVKHKEKYDIFISVRQEKNDRYTYDSDFAADLYYFMVSKGYKVFNSRITKMPVGEEYEPYIISALLSARVMIVVGTCAENMNAPWVKNEWSRFQWIQQSEKRSKGETDRLLLCYLAKGMQPKELPRALNPNRQAIMESVVSGEILSETLEEVFKPRKFRPRPLTAGKKQSKPATERIKTGNDKQKPTEIPVSTKEGEEPLKESAGKIVNKWVIGAVAALIVIVCFALSRMVGGNNASVAKETVTTESESDTAARESETAETEYIESLSDEIYFQCISALPAGRGFITNIVSVSGKKYTYYKASNGAGYVIRCTNKGMQGDVPAMVGISLDGIITGVYLPDNNEVEGIGSKATEYYRKNQSLFTGKIPESGSFTRGGYGLPEHASENEYRVVDAVSGATITSMAIINDVNDAITVFRYLTGFNEQATEEGEIESEILPDEAANADSAQPADDYVIDWKDDNLEKAMREVTGITDRDIMYSDVEGIYSLDLSEKGITDISALGDLTYLCDLRLISNNISDISTLEKLTHLALLQLDSNQISDISALENLTNLQILSLGSNNISDISALENLTKMILLSLGSNQISDISVLENLTNLHVLDLCSNNISDLSALKNMTKMTTLFLLHNQFSDISALRNLVNLKTLYIDEITDYSPIEDLEVEVKHEISPDTEITFQ